MITTFVFSGAKGASLQRGFRNLQHRPSRNGTKSGSTHRYANDSAVRSLLWTIRSVGIQIDRINEIWATKLGITGPQFLILAALADAHEENGTQVNRLAKALHVDPSFITTQTKILEKSGLLIRKPSAEDARVVLIRPSERLRKIWNDFSLRRMNLHNTVFSKLGGANVDQVRNNLSELEAIIQIAATLTELNADGESFGK